MLLYRDLLNIILTGVLVIFDFAIFSLSWVTNHFTKDVQCINVLLYFYFLFMYLYLVTSNATSRLMFQAAAPPPLLASSGKFQMLNHSPGAKHKTDASLRCKVQEIYEI